MRVLRGGAPAAGVPAGPAPRPQVGVGRAGGDGGERLEEVGHVAALRRGEGRPRDVQGDVRGLPRPALGRRLVRAPALVAELARRLRPPGKARWGLSGSLGR